MPDDNGPKKADEKPNMDDLEIGDLDGISGGIIDRPGGPDPIPPPYKPPTPPV
jgi:hypothetical protein